MRSKTDALVALGYIPHSRGDSDIAPKFNQAAFSKLVSSLTIYKEAKKRVSDGFKIMKGVYSFDEGDDEFTFYQKGLKLKWADYKPIGGTFLGSYDSTATELEHLEAQCVNNFIAFQSTSDKPKFNQHMNFLITKDEDLFKGLYHVLTTQTEQITKKIENGIHVDLYAMGEKIQEEVVNWYNFEHPELRDPSIKERAQETLEDVLDSGNSLIKTPLQTLKRAAKYMATPEFAAKAAVVGSTALLVVPYLGQTIVHLLGAAGILDHEKNKETSHFDHGTSIDHDLYSDYNDFLASEASRGSDNIPLFYANETEVVSTAGDNIMYMTSHGDKLAWSVEVIDVMSGYKIVVYNKTTDSVKEIHNLHDQITDFSIENDNLVFTNNGTVYLLNLKTDQQIQISDNINNYFAPKISNNQIAYAQLGGKNIFSNDNTGQHQTLLTSNNVAGLFGIINGKALYLYENKLYLQDSNSNLLLSNESTRSFQANIINPNKFIMSSEENNVIKPFIYEDGIIKKISDSKVSNKFSICSNLIIWGDGDLLHLYNITNEQESLIKLKNKSSGAQLFLSEDRILIGAKTQLNSESIELFDLEKVLNPPSNNNNNQNNTNNHTNNTIKPGNPSNASLTGIILTSVGSLAIPTVAILSRRRKS